MKHIDEETLELFVLDADSAGRRRKRIEKHLAECQSCRRLFLKMENYYEEAEAELKKPARTRVSRSERLPSRKRAELEPYFKPLEAEVSSYVEIKVPSVWHRINRFTRNNPVKSSFAMLAIAAIAYLSINYITRDNGNPAYYNIDTASHKLDVYSASNKLLWSVVTFAPNTDSSTQAKRTIIADLDRSGKNQVITAVPIGDEQWPIGVKVFNSEGKLVNRFEFPDMKVSYNNIHYEAPFGAAYLSKDVLPDGSMDLLVTANNHRSPSLVARLNNRLKVIGEYWHYGVFTVYPFRIPKFQGRYLLLAGDDDVDDMAGKVYPFVAVLDLDTLVGTTECSATPGFGLSHSRAELYYIRFPLTDLERATGKRSSATLDGMPGDSSINVGVLSQGGMNLPNSFGFDYVFDKRDMRVREVKFIMPTEQTYAKLKREGKLSGTFDQQYLENLKNGVRYWTGKEWVKEPTGIGQH